MPVCIRTDNGEVTTDDIRAVISFPPFYAVLLGGGADSATHRFAELMPIGPWLMEDYRSLREVALLTQVLKPEDSRRAPFDPMASMFPADRLS